MKSSIAVALGLAACVSAHSHVFGVWVNDAFQGDGRNVYVRSPLNNSPVKDVSQTTINCNTNNRAVPQSVSVKAGDKFTFEWYHDNRGDDIIDPTHKGPITVYIAPASSNGNGAAWTKLYEDGLSGGVWAVDKLIQNGGKHSLTLPSWLAAGDYLLRSEIIAHHESDTNYRTNSARGAQFYPSCTQIKVTSGGSTTPGQNFNFVGGYSPTDPGILFNLYGNSGTYTPPGPRVWTPSGSAPAPAPATPTTTKAPAASSPAPTKAPVVAPPATGGSVAKWAQCGGINYTGATGCASGAKCVKINDYYSQCQ